MFPLGEIISSTLLIDDLINYFYFIDDPISWKNTLASQYHIIHIYPTKQTNN